MHSLEKNSSGKIDNGNFTEIYNNSNNLFFIFFFKSFDLPSFYFLFFILKGIHLSYFNIFNTYIFLTVFSLQKIITRGEKIICKKNWMCQDLDMLYIV